MTLLLISACGGGGGNDNTDPDAFFKDYMSAAKMNDLIMDRLPDASQCAKVLKGDAADTYAGMVEEMKKSPPPTRDEEFVDIRVDKFTTEDIHAGKGNYAGGMERIKDKLQDGVTFHKVSLLRTEGAELGVAFKHWVLLDGQWVFFPKIWNAFR